MPHCRARGAGWRGKADLEPVVPWLQGSCPLRLSKVDLGRLLEGHHHLRASVPFLSKSPSCEMAPNCPSLGSWVESCSWGRALFPGDRTHPVPGGLTNQAENCSLRDNYLFGLFPVETLPAINSWQRSRAGRGPRSAPSGSVRGAGCAAEPVPGVSSTAPALFILKLL